MKKEGLLVEPDFSNIEKYIESGDRTQITDSIKTISQSITGETDGMLVRNILVWINQNTKRLHAGSDTRKFKRTANDILVSGERTGCCDSSTLFTALVRSSGIPAMQVITFDKEWARKANKNEVVTTRGHYFSACYIRDNTGTRDWILVDSDRYVNDIRDVRLSRLDRKNRNIDSRYYAFAYVRDYSDIEFNGIKIDSIENMAKIQMDACRLSDFGDLSFENETER